MKSLVLTWGSSSREGVTCQLWIGWILWFIKEMANILSFHRRVKEGRNTVHPTPDKHSLPRISRKIKFKTDRKRGRRRFQPGFLV